MPTKSPKQKQWLAALCLTGGCLAPNVGRAQCRTTERSARGDSALARPFTASPSATLRVPAVATSRGDPKLAAFRAAARDPRLRVAKDQPGPLAVTKEQCTEVVVEAPGVGITPFGAPGIGLPTPAIPAPALLSAPSVGRGGLFGGLLIGAVAAAVLGHNGQGGDIVGGTIGASIPPGGGTTPPGGGTTTPPSGGGETPGGETTGSGTPTSGGGTTPPGGGETTPPGGGATPPGGGGTTPPGGGTTPPGGGTTPPGGGTTPPGGITPPGGGTTPPGGTSTTPPGGITPPGGTTTPPGGGVTPPGSLTPPGGTPFPPTTPVPEPATLALVGAGVLLLGATRRRG